MKEEIIQKIGQPPGTLIYTGNRVGEFKIVCILYDSKEYRELEIEDVEECLPSKDSSKVMWLDLVGLHRVDVIEKIGRLYNIHPLVLEDIVNVNQRPKVEYFDEYIFLVVKTLTYNEASQSIESEQVAMILGKNFVLTFRETENGIFEPVRKRLRNNKGIIRKNGADYLLYALIDVIVDNYFVVLETLGGEIENLEDKVIFEPSPETVQKIHRLKRNLIEVRKTIWPLREALNGLYKGDSNLISKKTSPYFRDVYDHTVQIIETVETLRDMISGLLDVYLSSISNRTNEVMKVLTIIATIFIPLTFIAGIYGMNFKYMPELEWKYGYPAVLLVMLFIAVIEVIYFKKKKWL